MNIIFGLDKLIACCISPAVQRHRIKEVKPKFGVLIQITRCVRHVHRGNRCAANKCTDQNIWKLHAIETEEPNPIANSDTDRLQTQRHLYAAIANFQATHLGAG